MTDEQQTYRFVTGCASGYWSYRRGQEVRLGEHYHDDEIPRDHGEKLIEGGTLIPADQPLPQERT